MFETLIRGGMLVNADGLSRGDVGIAAGKVTAVIAPGEAAEARTVIDASGSLILPGLVDVGLQAVVSRDLSLIPRLLDLAPVSFELFTADVPDGFLFATLDDVAEALQAFAGADTLVGISPGDQSILAGSRARDRSGSIAAFLDSRPPLAEANGIARALVAAASAEAKVHVRQINSELGVETWSRLRGMADASVETTPQNL
ncbi:MAG: dihydroorotase, partial [Mesorhizobium sp.]